MADLLIKEWQQKWTEKYTSPLAQYARRVGSLERDLVEVIKYGSKIFTDFDVKSKGKIPPKIYIAALINIYKAMKPYHLFHSFGFSLPKQENSGTMMVAPAVECIDFEYAVEITDWVNNETGQVLSGYRPTDQLEWLLTENIDTDIQ